MCLTILGRTCEINGKEDLKLPQLQVAGTTRAEIVDLGLSGDTSDGHCAFRDQLQQAASRC